MVVRNTNSLIVTDQWAEKEFFPFLDAHRHLRTLHICVQDWPILNYEFMMSDINSEFPPWKTEPTVTQQQRDTCGRFLHNTLFSMFTLFVKDKFWWIKEFVLLKF